jgi:hypothetical protein
MSHVRYGKGFYIPEDGILHSHRHANLKSYICVRCFKSFLVIALGYRSEEHFYLKPL